MIQISEQKLLKSVNLYNINPMIIIIIIIILLLVTSLNVSQYSQGSCDNIEVRETDSFGARCFLPSRPSSRSNQPPIQ